MDSVRLSFLDHDTEVALDQTGAAADLIFLRLTATFRVGNGPLLLDGLIDTGVALTVFPERKWREFDRSMEWLAFPTKRSIDARWTTVSGLSGGSFRCRLGLVPVAIVDTDGHALAPVPVLAKFAEDNNAIPRILLGLFGGVLQGRRLLLEPDRRRAWLEERSRAGIPFSAVFDA